MLLAKKPSVSYDCNLGMWEVEVEGSGVQDQLWLHQTLILTETNTEEICLEKI